MKVSPYTAAVGDENVWEPLEIKIGRFGPILLETIRNIRYKPLLFKTRDN